MKRALLLLLITACKLDASYNGTTFKCDQGETCPDGTTCRAGYCLPADTGDGGTDGGNPAGPACATQITAGADHSCSVRDDKTVWCWGANEHGQLGDNTTTDRTLPVQVQGLADVRAVARGDAFTCAIVGDAGAVSCWGYDGNGNLGDGQTSDEHIPVAATGVTGATQIAAGYDHACALVGGAVWCWGANYSGQLGDGTNAGHPPSPIAALSGVKAIGAYDDATCVVTSDGAIACWGANDAGILGVTHATKDQSTSPLTVAGTHDATAVEVGDSHACMLTAMGAVACWGANNYGQLGTGIDGDTPTPQAVPIPATVTAISSGLRHTCAIDSTRALWCWGDGGYGQLGTGEIFVRDRLPKLAHIGDVHQVAAGESHTCTLDGNGAVACFGWDGRGQLGNGARTAQPQATPVPSLAGLSKPSSEGNHTCALDGAGGVQCWGENDNGELGDGTQTLRAHPVPVVGLANIVQVSAGYDHTLALDGSGNVYAWGWNNAGEVGPYDDDDITIPQKLAGFPAGGAKAVAAGGQFSCALLAASPNKVMCWGNGGDGQLGNGSFNDSGVPVYVSNLTGVTQLSVGYAHACAVTAGKVWCWGADDTGQLGANGTGSSSAIPLDSTVVNAAEVHAGGGYNCAMYNATGADAGKLVCWGYNGDGELGLGFSDYIDGDYVPNITTATALWTGDSAACVKTSDGAVSCWGAGWNAQAGLGFRTLTQPTRANAIPADAELAIGGNHGCAFTAAGGACWGDDRFGQLGDDVWDHMDPVAAQLVCD